VAFFFWAQAGETHVSGTKELLIDIPPMIPQMIMKDRSQRMEK
jgi:hypothetical protein